MEELLRAMRKRRCRFIWGSQQSLVISGLHFCELQVVL